MMPPRNLSRYSYTAAMQDADGRRYLTDRDRFVFRLLPDNRQHRVQEGDTLWTLASRYFAPMPEAAQLWWVIADFQPEPIIDPTLRLEPGIMLVIPSLRTVHEEIFAATRAAEA